MRVVAVFAAALMISAVPIETAAYCGVPIDVEIVGDYAYIAGFLGYGLAVVDVSDPTNPIFNGWVSTIGEANDINLSGNYACIASWNGGLEIVDVSNPFNPTYVSQYDPGPVTTELKVRDTLVFITSEHPHNPQGPARFQIINVADPHNPTVLSELPAVGWAIGMELYGRGIEPQDEDTLRYAYFTDASGLCVVDWSDPANPTYVGLLPGIPHSVEIHALDTVLYVACGYEGARVVGVEDPIQPHLLSTLSFTNVLGVWAGDAQNDLPNADTSTYAYFCDDNEYFDMYDVTDPANPIYRGSYRGIGDRLLGIDVVDGIGFTTEWSYALEVFDFSDPLSPLAIGGTNCGTAAPIADPTVPSTFNITVSPNPFNPTTSISFDLPASSHVTLDVYDLHGRRMASLLDTSMPAGSHCTSWNAEGLASGMYFFRLESRSEVITTRAVLLK
jgi:hypothetical protein